MPIVQLVKFFLCISIRPSGFPGGSEVKASACNEGDLSSIPGSGRSPGEGNGNPLQYSCLENPMDGGAWWATVHGVAKSWTQLSDFTSLRCHSSYVSDMCEWSSFHYHCGNNVCLLNFLSHKVTGVLGQAKGSCIICPQWLAEADVLILIFIPGPSSVHLLGWGGWIHKLLTMETKYFAVSFKEYVKCI